MCLQRSKEHKVAPRQVYQFHFTAWPDKSVPTQAGGVLSYLHDIHKKRDEIRDTGPLIVHCRYDCIVPQLPPPHLLGRTVVKMAITTLYTCTVLIFALACFC